MQLEDPHDQLTHWLDRCFGPHHVTVSQVVRVKQKPGREQWTCSVNWGAEVLPVVVKVFKPSAPDAVNASLPPVATAYKCALAKQELLALGMPTPICFRVGAEHETGVIIVEQLTQARWTASARVEAAQHLARLHQLPLGSLSVELQLLVQQSNPQPQRTYRWLLENVRRVEGLQPHWRTSYPQVAATADELLATASVTSGQVVLVHGDYFAANIIPSAAGIRIIDWETFALGDPMWDLAFLIGAERDLVQTEVDRVIAAYGVIAPVDLPSLLWHKRCWDTAWMLQDLVKQFSAEQNV